MARMRPPKVPEQPPAILREPELRALLHVVDTDRTFAGRRDAAILRLFIDTGARRAEVANLRWTPADPDTNDIDLDAGLVRVLGKGRRERLLSIGMKTVKSLDRYLRMREGHAAAATPLLWLGLKGRLIVGGLFATFWEPVCRPRVHTLGYGGPPSRTPTGPSSRRQLIAWLR